MANYWLHIIPLAQCDNKIRETHRYYAAANGKNKTIADLSLYPHVPNLSSVNPGDVVFICAHGHEQYGFITSHASQSARGLVRVECRNILHEFLHLRSGTAQAPISVKLLVCWAGGPSLTEAQLKSFYEDRDGVRMLKWGNTGYYNWAKNLPIISNINAAKFFGHANITLAKQLAVELGKTHQEVYFGGYPGALFPDMVRHDGKGVEVPNPRTGISIEEKFRHSAVWFGGDGDVYVRRPSLFQAGEYRFARYRDL